MWGKALGFIGSIFGSSESTNKAMDMISNGIDAAWFTREEKSQAAHKLLDLKLKWVQSTSGKNLARRVIAFTIVGIWAYILMLAVHFHIIGMTTQADFLFKVLKDIVNIPFAGIVSFYFLVQFTRGK